MRRGGKKWDLSRKVRLMGVSCKDVCPPDVCYLRGLDFHFLRWGMISLSSLVYPFQKLGETSCAV